MIREFVQTDLNQVVEVWLLSGKDEYSYLPDFQKLNLQSATDLFVDIIQSEFPLWVAEANGKLLGFMAIKDSYIDRLYVLPDQQRSGIGGQLIQHAKNLSPTGLELYTHQQNQRARSFYEKSGFKAVKFGVSPPPESLPDVMYQWRPDSAA